MTEIERAAEFGTETGDRPLMTMKLCLRRRLNLCPGAEGGPRTFSGPGPAKVRGEPLYLEDEEGRLFRVDFDCAGCKMTLKPGK